jgi:hypothetical protein
MKHWMMVFGLCIAQIAVAAPSRPDFHRAVYALHEQQIARHTIRTEETTGEYQGLAAAGYRYLITSYFDATSGRLLSRIQRDAKVPEAIHIAEVNVYDAEGRLIRDFFSSAPPWRPVHPSHAYINLHNHNGQLHSFRQHELEGQVNYEFCEGELEGKPVRIAHDGDDINEKTRASPEYRACFDGMSKDWARYTAPH